MRRALASLLILVMTFALVARGVAAPLLHLHPDAPGPMAPVSALEHGHDHADCDGAAPNDAVENDTRATPHAGHGSDKGSPSQHGKICDANGACCGPLALSNASESEFALNATPEAGPLPVSAGVKPINPDRPPSPLLA